MNERDELAALRRMAELEARAGGGKPTAPATPAAQPVNAAAPSMLSMLKDEAMTSLPGGFARGLKDIVDTGAQALATGYDKITGGDQQTLSSLVTGQKPGEGERIRLMNEAGKQDFKGAQDRAGAGGSDFTRVAGNVAATAPIGGALAGALLKVPGLASKAPSIIDAVRSSGITCTSSCEMRPMQ